MMDFLNNTELMENNLLTGKKILIVEDDFSSKLYLNKILEKANVIILNAGDGQEAVDIAFNNPDIDIILMDIQIPVIDGFEAMKKIREFRENIIIIAQTAYGLLGDKEKILSSGFNDYIIKPILTHNLIEKLNTNLKLAATQSPLK
ncbi:MAG TPA: response regulator [Bacteroidales bacterium]|nr:response regulator [Bacteroidales bacterium]